MAKKLAQKNCQPCQGGIPPLQGEAVKTLLMELGNGWEAIQDHHLEKEFAFADYKEAMEYAGAVGALAEEQNHHPDLFLSWGKVRVRIWTHKIDGLTESDFVFAAKAEEIYQEGFTS